MKFLSVVICAAFLKNGLTLMASSSQAFLFSLDESDSGSSTHTSSSVDRRFSIESCLSERVSSVERKLNRNPPIRDVVIDAAVVDADIDLLEEGEVDSLGIKAMNERVEDYIISRGTTLDEYFFTSIFNPNVLSLTSADLMTIFSSDFYMKKINSAFMRGVSLKRIFPKNNNLDILMRHYAQEVKSKSNYDVYCKKSLNYCALIKNNVLFYEILQDIKDNEVEDSFSHKLYTMFLGYQPHVYLVFNEVVKELEGNKMNGLSRYELMSISLSDFRIRVGGRLGDYSSALLPWVMEYACMKRFDLSFDEMITQQAIKSSLVLKEEMISKISVFLKQRVQDKTSCVKRDSYAGYIKLKSPFTSKSIDAACAAKMGGFSEAARYLYQAVQP